MSSNVFSSWPSFTREEAEAVSNVLLSNKVNYWTGDECRKFEIEFANWCGVGYAVAIANGTLALNVAFQAIGIGSGDEVIVTSRSFIASVSSIVDIGATPVFVDIDLDSQNITPETILEKITIKTKAIVCVHLAGWPCEMDKIMELANKFNLYVIEDCAQAHGAKYKGKSVGSFGNIGCWSFCQDKIITTGGEGGMTTTNDKSLWSKMWAYKDHGKSYDSVYKYKHPEGFRWLHDSFGSNYRLSEIQAVIGRIQLKKIDSWHLKRISNAQKIWNLVKVCSGLRVPNIPDNIEHAAYKCYIFLKKENLKEGWNQNRIIRNINALGVPCRSGSCSEIYLEKVFHNTKFQPKARLTNAKELGETSLMFLVHPTLTSKEIQKTCSAILSTMELASR
jgi:dTDP-4-amino-4,6-dideoxygalactose transaminase